MNIQKSFIDKKPTLYLIPTPIGNYDDMTFRAIETLKMVDIIYCEDTRVTYGLLSHFKIETPLRAYHIFNEDVASTGIIEQLKQGKNVGLVSDAGMPVISDPGYLVSSMAIKEGYNVVSLPGANAALTALIASSIVANSFTFFGFLDHKTSQKEKQLEQVKDYKETLIFYEAPHRIKETLQSIYKVLGDRNICIARELTKKYEEYVRGNVSEIIEADLEFKGEIVIIIQASDKTSTQIILNDQTIYEHFLHYVSVGQNDKEAMKSVAKDRGISKSEVYKEILKEKN